MAIHLHGSDQKPLIVHEIKAGEIVNFDGPVEVETSIGEGAIVKLSGSLKVHQNVGKGAKISTTEKPKASAVSFSSNEGSVTLPQTVSNVYIGDFAGDLVISDDAITISQGKSTEDIFAMLRYSQDIEVLGTTADDVTYYSGGNIKLNNSGNNLSAKAQQSIKGGSFGENAYLEANNKIEADRMNANGEVHTPTVAVVHNAHVTTRISAGINAVVRNWFGGEKLSRPHKAGAKDTQAYRFNF